MNLKRLTLQTCCCCKVRTACIVFGIVGALSGLLDFYHSTQEIITIATQNSSSVSEMEVEFKETDWHIDRDVIEEAILMSKVFSGFDLLTGLGLFLASFCMIYGIKKEKDRFLLPIIYYIPIDGAFRFIQVTAYTFTFGFLHPISAILNVTFIISIIIDFFIWLCVYSHRRQIKYELKDAEEMEEMT